MQSVMIIALGLAGMAFGWFVYSKFIATKIYQLDPNFVTPAHELEDGVDYVPTNKFVLWGHHFTSVAGAAPIVGPAIAVYWGWVPAVLWVTIGTIFFAGVHDFGAIWASARHKGKSIGALSEEGIGRHARDVVTSKCHSLYSELLEKACIKFRQYNWNFANDLREEMLNGEDNQISFEAGLDTLTTLKNSATTDITNR